VKSINEKSFYNEIYKSRFSIGVILLIPHRNQYHPPPYLSKQHGEFRKNIISYRLIKWKPSTY
jgi:hypothetical protein